MIKEKNRHQRQGRNQQDDCQGQVEQAVSVGRDGLLLEVTENQIIPQLDAQQAGNLDHPVLSDDHRLQVGMRTDVGTIQHQASLNGGAFIHNHLIADDTAGTYDSTTLKIAVVADEHRRL